jgi:hypothetical protein
MNAIDTNPERDATLDHQLVETLMSHQCDDRIAIYVLDILLGRTWWPFLLADRHLGFSFDMYALVLTFDHNGFSHTVTERISNLCALPARAALDHVLAQLAARGVCMVPVRLNHYIDGSEYVTNVLVEGHDSVSGQIFYTKINYGNATRGVPMPTEEFKARMDDKPGEGVQITTFRTDGAALPKSVRPRDLMGSLGFAVDRDDLTLDGFPVTQLHRSEGLDRMRDLLGTHPQLFFDDGAVSKRTFVLLSNRLGFKIKPMLQFSAALLSLQPSDRLAGELAAMRQLVFVLWKDAGLFFKTGDMQHFENYHQNFIRLATGFSGFQVAQSEAILTFMKGQTVV